MDRNGKPAIVLTSGGLDSTTCLAVARAEGFAPLYSMTFDYGQRHRHELAAAERVARQFGAAEHRVIRIDLRQFGKSALTADDIAVPKDRDESAMTADVPVTYVPARNTIFLSYALAWAEVLGVLDVFVGVNSVDYSVGGNARVWVRSKPDGARLVRLKDFYDSPPGHFQTLAVDRDTLRVGWRRVTGRWRHACGHKRSFRLLLERGQQITVTEDHSLFTIDEATAGVVTIRGADVTVGTPIVVPHDLSDVAGAWDDDLPWVDVSGLPGECAARSTRRSIRAEGETITNRLGRTRIPIHFPLSDEFLYVVGLWLAEGGKDPAARNTSLSFSVGGIPGAVAALQSYFGAFGVAVRPSPANRFDYHVCSSVFNALFRHLGLYGTAKSGRKAFPPFFWQLSQRQRRIILAGLWDGDGSHALKGTAVLAQKSHALIDDAYHCLLLDGIFPKLKHGPHSQKLLLLHRSSDFRNFVRLYPLRHASKRDGYAGLADRRGKDQSSGLWKCPGVWDAVASAELPAGAKTRIYNQGGKYDHSFRARRSAFAAVPSLATLTRSKLAFLRVTAIEQCREEFMYDLSVEGAENFLANGILAHNSGYPDCRPEFVSAFETMANLATKMTAEGRQRFRLHTPLIHLTKAQIIRRGVELGVDYGLTHSCYDPDPQGRACGHCDSCLLRKKGFAEAGVPDPTVYVPVGGMANDQTRVNE